MKRVELYKLIGKRTLYKLDNVILPSINKDLLLKLQVLRLNLISLIEKDELKVSEEHFISYFRHVLGLTVERNITKMNIEKDIIEYKFIRKDILSEEIEKMFEMLTIIKD